MKAKELKAIALKANSEQAKTKKAKTWMEEELYPLLERLAEKGETGVVVNMRLKTACEVSVDYVMKILQNNGFDVTYDTEAKWLWINWE